MGNRLLSRARFYDALAVAIDAGLPIDRALTASVSDERVSKIAMPALVADVASGRVLAASIADHVAGCTPSEVSIIEAGERGGQLPAAFARLSKHLVDVAAFRRQLSWKLAYPIGLVHAAVLLPTLPVLIRSGLSSYLATVGTLLVGIYAVTFAVWFFFQTAAAKAVLPAVPVVGVLVRSQAVADYTFVLASLLGAGAALPESLSAAATSIALPSFRAAGLRVAIAVRSGGTLGDAFSTDEAVFGSMLVEQVRIGETAGKLDDLLAKAEVFARHEAEQAAKLLTVLLSGLALAVAALVVAWGVLDFWSGYADVIDSIGLIPGLIP